jgi:hypothetical protein
MYLSAERLAIAEREVFETFEQTSIAWQAIPHWDTGDPGQVRVRNDVVNAPGPLNIGLDQKKFKATLAQLGAPTPDPLVAEVMARTADLAADVDDTVLKAMRTATGVKKITLIPAVPPHLQPEELMDALIDARASVETAGYRAPSCLITNTEGLKRLNAFSGGYPVTDSILSAVNINAVHRASQLDKPPSGVAPQSVVMLLVGRRQRMAQGAAADASPGEEPVDLAVSDPPSLELVGEDSTGKIELAVRIRYVTRVKDVKGVVLLEQ